MRGVDAGVEHGDDRGAGRARRCRRRTSSRWSRAPTGRRRAGRWAAASASRTRSGSTRGDAGVGAQVGDDGRAGGDGDDVHAERRDGVDDVGPGRGEDVVRVDAGVPATKVTMNGDVGPGVGATARASARPRARRTARRRARRRLGRGARRVGIRRAAGRRLARPSGRGRRSGPALRSDRARSASGPARPWGRPRAGQVRPVASSGPARSGLRSAPGRRDPRPRPGSGRTATPAGTRSATRPGRGGSAPGTSTTGWAPAPSLSGPPAHRRDHDDTGPGLPTASSRSPRSGISAGVGKSEEMSAVQPTWAPGPRSVRRVRCSVPGERHSRPRPARDPRYSPDRPDQVAIEST